MFRHPSLAGLDLRALFNASPNPYALIDREHRFVGVNEAFLATTRRRVEDLLGRRIDEAFPLPPGAPAAAQVRESLQRAFAEGSTERLPNLRYPIAGPDGTLDERCWSVTNLPVRGPDGEVVVVMQHAVDVTEWVQLRRRVGADTPAVASQVMRAAGALQAEHAAQRAELDALRRMFDQAPGFMVVMGGPRHVMQLANAAYVQLVGHRPFLGLPVREALPELAGQGYFELLDGVYASGRPFIGRGMLAQLQRVPGATLEPRHVDFVFQPLTDGDGAVVGIFVQGHDVSERVAAQHAAQDSEERFRTLAHSMPQQVWTARPDGRLDWCNDQTYRYVGLPAGDDATPDGWTRHVHPDEGERAFAAWRHAVAGGGRYHAEFRLRRHDGAWRWHVARALPQHDAAGALVRWIGTNTDIDDDKRAAALLADLNAELARRVEQRSAELLQVQETLRQSQKMEAIGQLSGGIAHDFNNLLQVIGGNLQLLHRELAGAPAVAERLAKAQAGVERGARLAAQLLAFARRQPLAPEVLDVGHLLEGTGQLLLRTLGEGVALRVAVQPGLWPACVDRANLESALLNLALNARDALAAADDAAAPAARAPQRGQEGAAGLTITAANTSLDEGSGGTLEGLAAGDYVRLAVTDTGCGMPPEVAARAFEPFFTTKPQGRGTGLGLSMVYGFAKQSGGHATIHSVAGQGTTVTLYLPRCSGPVPAAAPPSAPAAVPTAQGTVLLVDDDDAVREVTAAMLEALGCTVLQARAPQAALDLLAGGAAVDLLFSDVVMPGPLRAADLVREARALRPGLPVLMTSGYADRAGGLAGGLDTALPLLSKPYSPEALAQRLRRLLGPPAPPPAAPLRVLLCEDDVLLRETVQVLLEDLGCTVHAAGDAAEARRRWAEHGAPDLLVTDLGLPGGESGAALARWALQTAPGCTVALCSGRLDAPAEALPPGTERLHKPFAADDLARLVATVRQRRAAPAA